MKTTTLNNGDTVVYNEDGISEDKVKSYKNALHFYTLNPKHLLLSLSNKISFPGVLPNSFKKDMKSEYVNEMSDNKAIHDFIKKQRNQNNLLYADLTINDAEIPEAYKAIGGKIKREIRLFQVKFNKKGEPLVYSNQLHPQNSRLLGFQKVKDASITIFSDVFKLSSKDCASINKVKKVFDALGEDNLEQVGQKMLERGLCTEKELNIFAFYLRNCSNSKTKKNEMMNTVVHEIKHSQNNTLIKERDLNLQSEPLSLENIYRLAEDDEKSANVASAFYAIEKYFKNDEDISYLKSNRALSNKIEELTDANDCTNAQLKQKLKKYLTNYNEVAKDVTDFWDSEIAPWYRETNGQFDGHLNAQATKYPSYKLNNDSSIENKEYLARRNLMYQFEVYNPDTGKKEPINVEKDVKHASISLSREARITILKGVVYTRKAFSKITPFITKAAKKANKQKWKEYLKLSSIQTPINNWSFNVENKSKQPEAKYQAFKLKPMEERLKYAKAKAQSNTPTLTVASIAPVASIKMDKKSQERV